MPILSGCAATKSGVIPVGQAGKPAVTVSGERWNYSMSRQVTLLTERRRFTPYGLGGGEPGQTGRNVLIRADEEIELPGKTTLTLHAGDILRIETPGGGGYGQTEPQPRHAGSLP